MKRPLYDGHGEESIDLNSYCTPNPASEFKVKMDSDEMRGAGIIKGDLLLIDRDVLPKDGAIVMVTYRDAFLVRRLEGEILHTDPETRPIRLAVCQHWGTVVGMTRRY